jgi:hypothetical protein
MLPDTPQTSPMRGEVGGGESSGETSDPGDPAARSNSRAAAAPGSDPRPGDSDAGQASGSPVDVDHSPGPTVAEGSDSVGWRPGPGTVARPEEVWVGGAGEDGVVRVVRDGTWQADWV